MFLHDEGVARNRETAVKWYSCTLAAKNEKYQNFSSGSAFSREKRIITGQLFKEQNWLNLMILTSYTCYHPESTLAGNKFSSPSSSSSAYVREEMGCCRRFEVSRVCFSCAVSHHGRVSVV